MPSLSNLKGTSSEDLVRLVSDVFSVSLDRSALKEANCMHVVIQAV